MRLFIQCFGLSCAGILLLWITNTAIAGQSDAQLISTLESGGYEKIKSVAQQIHNEKNFSTPVLDTLAAVIYQSYEVPDRRVIDTLSLGCMVIGESERYRYLKLIDEIGRLAPNKDLRDACTAAADAISDAGPAEGLFPEHRLVSDEIEMKPIWYPDRQIPAQHVSYRIYPKPLRKKMMKRNLDRIETIRTGSLQKRTRELKRIYADQGKTPFEINEAVARIIWDFVKEDKSLAGDSVGLACEAVGVSGSNRYRTLVFNAMQLGAERNDDAAKQCRLVYDGLSDASETEQFTPAYLLAQEFREEVQESVSDLVIVREQLSFLRQQRSEGLIDKKTYDIRRESILANL